MSELAVSAWHGCGAHRLHVDDVAGVRVGWHDLTTGISRLEVAEQADAFTAAVQAALTADPRLRLAYLVATELVSPIPEQRVPEQWSDLAQHRPAESTGQPAERERQTAPAIATVACVHTAERARRPGPRGVELVMGQLSGLSTTWRVLHSIAVGTGGAIDHLVIGPGGVYTIDTRHHPNADVWVGGDTLVVDRQKQPYVGNAARGADSVARLLTEVCGQPVQVTGLVAIVGAHALVVEDQPTHPRVFVLQRREIRSWLRQRAPVLGGAEIETLYNHARRSTTCQH